MIIRSDIMHEYRTITGNQEGPDEIDEGSILGSRPSYGVNQPSPCRIARSSYILAIVLKSRAEIVITARINLKTVSPRAHFFSRYVHCIPWRCPLPWHQEATRCENCRSNGCI